jgi:hypothetical protein
MNISQNSVRIVNLPGATAQEPVSNWPRAGTSIRRDGRS